MQVEVVGIKFKNSNHIYSFDPNDLELKKGEYVLVDTEKGADLGVVIKEREKIDATTLQAPLKKVLKIATKEMVKKAEEYDKEAENLYPQVKSIVKEFGLEMKIVKIEANYDNTRYVINFTSENRVDFRELVKKLAETFKKRIELRQIGSRDEVRMLGGFGPCGKICCCVQNMGEFDHVSMKMAKNQNLSLNPASISGLCGKLMCCIAYENSTYQESIKLMPKVGAQVSTKEGKGTVVFNDLLKREVDVKFVKGEDSEIKTFTLDQINFKKEN
ncbi:MAG: stage 0 sporulation protein [Clostridiales bacterium]|nr:stage 0 sporulation protein [Clostridiales bacterium]